MIQIYHYKENSISIKGNYVTYHTNQYPKVDYTFDVKYIKVTYNYVEDCSSCAYQIKIECINSDLCINVVREYDPNRPKHPSDVMINRQPTQEHRSGFPIPFSTKNAAVDFQKILNQLILKLKK